MCASLDGRRGSELTGWGQDVVDKDEDGLLGAELDPFPDDVHELPSGQVSRHQVLLLVNIRDITSIRLFANYRDPIRILASYTLSLALSLFYVKLELN